MMVLPLYYNWRNLLARKLSTGLTFAVVGVVVFVLAVLLSFAAGIRAALVATGCPLNVIVLKPGATSESTSILLPDEINRVLGAAGIARQTEDCGESPAGSLLVSPELNVQTDLPRRDRGGGATANVAVRGVDDVAFAVRSEVRLIAGRRFRQGALELIVGQAARDRYAGLNLGDTVTLGRHSHRRYQVVGVFSAGGGALESEIWAPRTMLADAYSRPFASSVCLRVSSVADVPAAVAYINGPAVRLEARPEPRYYQELARTTREIVWLTTVLVGLMAVGAMFAVANTMYSAVDNRRRELAMLRTIGFGRGAVLLAILFESVLVCALACAAGLAGSATFSGARQDYLSDITFTVLAYEPRLTPGIVAAAVGTAILVGVGGALPPALRAARLNIIEAVRKG